MKAAARIDWRRWVAMLCISLMSAFAIAPAHADEYGAMAAAFAIDGHVIHRHAAPNDQSQPEQQPPDGSEPHYHCGGVHAASIATNGAQVSSSRAKLAVVIAPTSSWVTPSPIYDLERPPRQFA